MTTSASVQSALNTATACCLNFRPAQEPRDISSRRGRLAPLAQLLTLVSRHIWLAILRHDADNVEQSDLSHTTAPRSRRNTLAGLPRRSVDGASTGQDLRMHRHLDTV